MPWANIKSAKKAGAITKYLKKAVSLTAINKLYDIYDSIKATGKADNPFAVAMDSWKELIKLKNGRIWVLKPEKKKKSEQAEVELPFPSGISNIKDGSFETFKDELTKALKDYFGKDDYVYIVKTLRTKIVISVEDRQTYTAEYYEVPYKITKTGIEFGEFTKVIQTTIYQKVEQMNREFRKKIKDFVEGKSKIGEAVGLAIKLRRELICRPKN